MTKILEATETTVQTDLGMSDGDWLPARDGDDSVRAIFDRHYSRRRYTDGRRPRKFVGPGENMVLRTARCDAIFVWRKELYRLDGQQGINCAVFRNEGELLASDLIREAMRRAWERWPNERLFTFVDSSKVKSANPGYCFLVSGWRKCGVSKGGLLILEALPEVVNAGRSGGDSMLTRVV